MTSRAKVWHDADGFHSEVDTKVAGLVLTLPGQEPLVLDIPTPETPIEIPGILRITLGEKHVTQKPGFIFARAQGLLVEILATHTKVKIALSRARMTKDIVNSIMSGFAAGLRGTVLDPVLTIGRTPSKDLPCEGTGGEEKGLSTVGLDIPGVLTVGALNAKVFGVQTGRRRARAYAEASIAEINLLAGAVVIEGIQARANVSRRPGKLVTNTNGTETLKITVNGEEIALPPLGEILDIPGLLSIEQGVTSTVRGGIEVVALRVKLLDGTGAVIDLGIARAQVKKAIIN